MAISRAARTSHAAEGHRHRSGGFRNQDHRCGQARDSSRQSHDIEEQETGAELAPKLPQIVSSTTPGAAKNYSTALNRPRGTTFCSTLIAGGSISGPRYQLTNLSPRVSLSPPSLLCSRPLHCSPLLSFSHTLKRARTGDDAILSSIHPPRLRCSPYGFPACHLSLSRALRRHSSILAESEEPRYFFFHSLSFSFTGGARRGFFFASRRWLCPASC